MYNMFKGLFTPTSSPKPRADSPATIGRSPSNSMDESQTIADLILESARVIPPQFIDGIRAELITDFDRLSIRS
jgi:hypothetical protein